jgi:thymidylate synthase
VDTLSTFGYYYEHDLRDGFPLLTTKFIEWRHIVIELLWFLTGTNGQDFLERHGIKFWRPWYRKDGNVNAAYGPAWRRFEYPSYYESDSGLSCMDGPCTGYNDQIGWVVRQLQEKPMRRDLVVSAWQPHIVQYPPTTKTYWAPCHCMFILNVQNEYVALGSDAEGLAGGGDPSKDYRSQRLCLHLTQRSCDVALGVPYNLASYALLCSILARLGGMEPGVFGHSLVDAHVYTKKADGDKAEYDHIPGLLEQLERPERELPRLIIDDSIRSLKDIEALLDPKVTTEEIMGKFRLEGYDPHPKIKFKVAV